MLFCVNNKRFLKIMPEEKTSNKKTAKNGGYSAKDIYVLEGVEPVRKRPGMYIGSTGPDGLQHLLVEIFDNSRDEAMNGFCNEVEVALLPNGLFRIADKDRWLPYYVLPFSIVGLIV